MNSINKIPLDGISGLKENWKSDIMAGFTVFLIALPLCIGIANASGAPPVAGLFAGIVGGLVCSLLGGSYVTINGPAAGLIVIVLGAISTLGKGDNTLGFKLTLAAIVVASLFQIILGLSKGGYLEKFFPFSVVHGMMAAIGIIIFIKQSYIAIGVAPVSKTIPEQIIELPKAIMNLNPDIALIGGISILILIFVPMIKLDVIKKLPIPLIVVIVGIALGNIFDLKHEHVYFFSNIKYHIGENSLVNVPKNIADGLTPPNFDRMFTLDFLEIIITISLVGSLESLLTASAMDKKDPFKRRSDMDRELVSKGVGNLILGLIGGIPIIAEVVRSSANIDNGAKTRWANFFHGLFLLLFLLLAPSLLHTIPLACLAAILMMVGLRLANYKQFMHSYKLGFDQFIPFIITIVLTIAEDLLVGVFAGLAANMIIFLLLGVKHRELLQLEIESTTKQDEIEIHISKVLVFSNFVKLEKLLRSIPQEKRIILDMSSIKFLEHTAHENLLSFKEIYIGNGGKFDMINMEHLTSISDEPTSTRRLLATHA